MLRISAAALILFGTGFLQVMFSIASILARPGQNVTMWCPHNIHVTGNLFWFKQTDGAVPVAIVHMSYTESLREVEPNYFNNFTKDHMVMDQFSKNTSLTIKQVKMSDSGFYFCGAKGYHKFGNGTRLQVKDHEQSSVSIEDCSRGIYFKLTLLFGGIIFFTCIVPLILAIIREHRRQKHKKAVAECQAQQHNDKENDSVEYAAVYFSNKRPKTARRHTKDPTAVYTNTT
ncbi:uncharacterized protein LOC131544336 [Onychostoma macrolepis]|uniref:Ig-like domain-containing protein n=1 Tax=Onychostoma macrolepis TaxID=369639 RepID=A0A7J6CW33_9TELE|nr:uncharacterized protein LOC131544336 [Onychostoma macrolepis]KAF4111480.1 hypothetical protein G5714_008511 [Onychostoma macrolepis]